MNLVKIADMLKNASDQSLASELQNPTGSVPSYMVLSELERRKKLRGSIMQPENNKTVAEEKEAEFAGIGGLQQQARPQPEDRFVSQEDQAQGYAYGGEVKNGVVHARKGWFGEDLGDYADTDPTYTSDTAPGGLFRTDQMIKPAFSAEQSAQRRQLIASGVSPDNASRMVRGEAILNTPSGAAPTINPNVTLIDNAAAPPAAPGGPSRKTNLYSNPVRDTQNPAAPAAVDNGLGFDPRQYLQESYKEGIEGLKSYNDYMKQAIAENKAQRAENIGYALMQAGMGIAGGRSQYAMENIGQGALMGIQQLQGAENARQREGRALAMDMAQSGLKSSEIKANLAKLGFSGDYYTSLAQKAKAEANIGIPATARYHDTMGRAAIGRLDGAGKIDPKVKMQATAYENQIDNLQTRLKGAYLPKEKAAIQSQIDELVRRKAKLLDLDLGGGPAPAATGSGLQVTDKGLRYGYQ